MNAVEIEEAITLLSEQSFDPDSFPYAFLEAFGNKAPTIKRLKTGNNNKSDIDGGIFQRNNIHLVVCSEGEVAKTLDALRESSFDIHATIGRKCKNDTERLEKLFNLYTKMTNKKEAV